MTTQSERRRVVVRNLAFASAAAVVLCVGILCVQQLSLFPLENSASSYDDFALRGGGRRRLPGYDFHAGQLTGAQAGFVAAVILILLLALFCRCCCCCCQRRRRGYSLCDILACVCLYEICCDDARIGDFVLV